MKKNSLFSTIGWVVLAGIALMLLASGCKKDDSSPTTTPPVNKVSYGSGTVTAASTAGSLTFTGTGVYPFQAGPSVLAVYDTSILSGMFFVYGYQQVSGSHYNVAALGWLTPGRVDTGTFTHPTIFVAAAYNADTTLQADSLVYQSVSGTITVISVNGSNAWGTYSVMARKGSAQPIQFTGTFNVTYVVGTMPGRSDRSVYGRASWPPELR